MKKCLCLILAVVWCVGVSASVVVDSFETYSNGSILGQGNWFDRENGSVFRVVDDMSNDGSKSIFCNNNTSYGIITKKGTPYADGYQSISFRPVDFEKWRSPLSFQIAMFEDSWDGPCRAVMQFKSDGNFYTSEIFTEPRGSFRHNEWNTVEIEWRSVDASARYNVNLNGWTEWMHFTVLNGHFSYFDTIGISAIDLGEGGVYVDSAGTVPEPAYSSVIILVLSGLLFLKKRQ